MPNYSSVLFGVLVQEFHFLPHVGMQCHPTPSLEKNWPGSQECNTLGTIHKLRNAVLALLVTPPSPARNAFIKC